MSAVSGATWFHWSAPNGLPADWKQRVLRAVKGSEVAIEVMPGSVIGISLNTSDNAVQVVFEGERPAGTVRDCAGARLAVCIAKIALHLGFDLANDSGNSYGHPDAEAWFRSLTTHSIVAELIREAENCGLLPKQFELGQLNALLPVNDTVLF